MALFGSKKNKEEKAVKAEKAVKPAKEKKSKKEPKVAKEKAVKAAGVVDAMVASTLLKMRVTEKVTMLAEKNNVYTFGVGEAATKNSVAEAINKLYKVMPLKVRILPVPKKSVFVRGKWGVKGGGRKAYIYLKPGEKLE